MTVKTSPMYKYKDNNPTISLLTLAPCKDRRELNKVESSYRRMLSGATLILSFS